MKMDAQNFLECLCSTTVSMFADVPKYTKTQALFQNHNVPVSSMKSWCVKVTVEELESPDSDSVPLEHLWDEL